MISNQIVSEILGLKCEIYPDLFKLGPRTYKNYVRLINRDLLKCSGYGNELQINIYELSFLCKEYAFQKGYSINSYIDEESLKWTSEVNKDRYSETFSNFASEPEAVFAAIEFVFSQEPSFSKKDIIEERLSYNKDWGDYLSDVIIQKDEKIKGLSKKVEELSSSLEFYEKKDSKH